MPNRIVHDIIRAQTELSGVLIKIENTKKAIAPFKTNVKRVIRLRAWLVELENRRDYLQKFIITNDIQDEDDDRYDEKFEYRRIR